MPCFPHSSKDSSPGARPRKWKGSCLQSTANTKIIQTKKIQCTVNFKMFMYNLYNYLVYDNTKILQFHYAIESALAECWWRFHTWIEIRPFLELLGGTQQGQTFLAAQHRACSFSVENPPCRNMFQISNFRFPETIVRGETPRFTIKCETCFGPGFFGANFLFTSEQMLVYRVFLSESFSVSPWTSPIAGVHLKSVWWNWCNDHLDRPDARKKIRPRQAYLGTEFLKNPALLPSTSWKDLFSLWLFRKGLAIQSLDNFVGNSHPAWSTRWYLKELQGFEVVKRRKPCKTFWNEGRVRYGQKSPIQGGSVSRVSCHRLEGW